MRHPKFFTRALVISILCGLSFSSCVVTRTVTGKLAHRPYRMDNHEADEKLAFAQTTQNLSDGTSGKRVDLGFIEFDDQGELWKLNNEDGGITQLNIVLKDLQEKVSQGPLKVIVFIHGWNNNASPANEKSGNLASFKRVLKALDHSCDTPVYGVYVSWRGSSWPFPTGIDLWDRDAAARRIGGPTMLAALRAISTTAHQQKKNRVIMVGHSFGGKILTQVTSQHLASEIGRALGEKDSVITPLADTVVVINSATNGSEMRQVNELMQVHRITYKRGSLDVPLFVTIASESDSLVHTFLPVYQHLNRDVLAFPDRGGDVVNQKQSKSLYRAMGHNPDLLDFALTSQRSTAPSSIHWQGTESIHEAVVRNIASGARATNAGLDVWLQTTTEPSSMEKFTLIPTRRGPDGYQLPSWGFRVPDFAVSAHSGLWQPNFVALIAALDGLTRPPAASGAAIPKPTLRVERLTPSLETR